MSATARGYRYPGEFDPADIPLYIQQLATDVDTDVTAAKIDAGSLLHNTGLSITAATGWGSLDYFWIVRNGWQSLRMEVTRTGAALTASGSGGIANNTMATVNTAAARPPMQWQGRAYASFTGGTCTLNTDGTWILTDLNSSSTISTGDFVRCVLTYPI